MEVLDSAGSGLGPVAGFCEHGDEPSGSIKKAGYTLNPGEINRAGFVFHP
jgi:hypothetical protein